MCPIVILSPLLLENKFGVCDSFLYDGCFNTDQARGKDWLANKGKVFTTYQHHLKQCVWLQLLLMRKLASKPFLV